MNLSTIVEKLNATLEGDSTLEITSVASLKDAQQGQISFLSNPKYTSQVASTKASAVLVSTDWEGEAPCTILRVENPDEACALVADLFYEAPPKQDASVHPTAYVAPSAQLAEGVSIGANVTIEEGVIIGKNSTIMPNCYVGYKTIIGDDCLLYPMASTREATQIGNRVIIHNGTVLGSDGFGYAEQGDGSRVKIPQIGNVVIEDDVEIGANCSIDRARFGTTRIGKGTKLDNLVHVAHNVTIGENSVICGQVGIAGSSAIGDRVIMAGQVGIAGHTTVGNDVIVGSQAGVTKDVPEKSFLIGSPAMPHLQFKKMLANTLLLPKLKQRVKDLEKQCS